MISSILAAIAAIPEILAAIKSLLSYMDKMEKAGFFAANAKWQQDTASATTEDSYKAAEKELADTLRKL